MRILTFLLSIRFSLTFFRTLRNCFWGQGNFRSISYVIVRRKANSKNIRSRTVWSVDFVWAQRVFWCYNWFWEHVFLLCKNAENEEKTMARVVTFYEFTNWEIIIICICTVLNNKKYRNILFIYSISIWILCSIIFWLNKI